MTCRQALSLLDDYLDNELDPLLVPEVKSHIADCSDCRIDFEESQRLKELLRTNQPPEPRPEYWDELSSLTLAKTTEHDTVAAFKKPAEPRPGEQRDVVRSSLALAASVCILFGALYLGSQKGRQARPFNPPDAPVLITASLRGLVGGSPSAILTKREYVNLVAGSALMGTPGPLGKALGLIDLLTF